MRSIFYKHHAGMRAAYRECSCNAHETDDVLQPSFQFDDVVFSQECADVLAGNTHPTGKLFAMNTSGSVYESKVRHMGATWSERVTIQDSQTFLE